MVNSFKRENRILFHCLRVIISFVNFQANKQPVSVNEKYLPKSVFLRARGAVWGAFCRRHERLGARCDVCDDVTSRAAALSVSADESINESRKFSPVPELLPS